MKQYQTIFFSSVLLSLNGCFVGFQDNPFEGRVVPAEEFTYSVKNDQLEEYSIYRTAEQQESRAQLRSAELQGEAVQLRPASENHYLQQGFQHKATIEAPKTEILVESAPEAQARPEGFSVQQVSASLPPYGSRAPYHNGPMTTNPSLWPDEGQGAAFFRDFRAFEAMDIVTIIINEKSEGKKKADTEATTEYSVSAAISKFFGIETKTWAANNEALDPTALVNATTSKEFEGEGTTNRSGQLKARISAVILEVLPNGLLRVEGTKIVSINAEEEVMVLSGLIRPRDVTAANEVDSNRIANMRVDFYGRGLIASQQTPGWGARIFDFVWPF